MKEKNKEENKNLWNEFQSVENNSEGLVKKAKAVAPILLTLITSELKVLFKCLQRNELKDLEIKITPEKEWKCFLEYTAFLLHFIDRQVWNILGEEELRETLKETKGFDKKKADEALSTFKEKRILFMKTLVFEVNEGLSMLYGAKDKQFDFKVTFLQLLDERQKEYGKYEKYFPQKDEGMKNTLFWEFAEKITKTLANTEDVRVILIVSDSIFSVIEELNLNKLLKTKSINKKS